MSREHEASGGNNPPLPRTTTINLQMQSLTQDMERLLRRQGDEIHERLDKLERE
ncbi:hypothetical protein SESBI_48549, partial [Sesbania bispinosa]